MYDILIAGAGYVGKEIARYFRKKNQRVYGLVQSEKSAAELKAADIHPIVTDVTLPNLKLKLPPAHFIVISLAPDQRDAESYRKTYLDGVMNMLQAIEKNTRPHLLLYLSSTRVWEKSDPGWVTEKTEPSPETVHARILLEAERQVLTSPLPSVVFRLSGIYGPARNRIKTFREQRFRTPGPDKYLNLIHRDDIVQSVPVLFKKAAEGEIYLGVDEEPVRESGFYEWLSAELRLGYPQGLFDKEKIIGKKCSNAKLKSLGVSFRYPDFRSGYGDLLKTEVSARG